MARKLISYEPERLKSYERITYLERKQMKILLYMKKNGHSANRLQTGMAITVPDDSIEIVRTVEDLSRSFMQPENKPAIAIIMVTDRHELLEVLTVYQFLSDARIILILPDNGEDLFALGCKLYPRFVSYASRDFKDVLAVVEKMMKNLSATATKTKKTDQILGILYGTRQR